MSFDRRIDKDVVHIHNGILLSHKKGHLFVSSDEVDEPRPYYTEWSKSEREKLILYINAYIWNLERWYWWTDLQGSNKDAPGLRERSSDPHKRLSQNCLSVWGSPAEAWVSSDLLQGQRISSFFIQKTKIIAASPITSWQIDGETMETVTSFIFLDSKIIADGDCYIFTVQPRN